MGSTLNYSLGNERLDYSKIKIGVKTLNDAVMNLGEIPKIGPYRISKSTVLKALAEKDLNTLRMISDYFYNISGIYQRACNYFAQLYRYDWYVIPEFDDESAKSDKVLKDFKTVLSYLDNSYIKKVCGDIALKVVKDGCYYGCIVDTNDAIVLQDLPIKYCRSRFTRGGLPVVEFNMAYFDEKFPNINYRLKILKMFPEDFARGYTLYKQGKLKEDVLGQSETINERWSNTSSGWYMLEPETCVKFNLNNSDVPVFASAIPAIIDLDAAQDLDRRKQMQQLLKIIVQKLPLDKNGDLIFDIDEAREVHNNAVDMLRRCIGVDVMTTFADVMSINTSDKNTTATQDDLAKVERSLYNALGLSKNLFNTDGNLSLEKSILDDESTVRNLLLQFAIFYDKIIMKRNPNRKKYNFRFYMMETTQYNYQNLSKMFKEQMQNGYPKMLPQIALGLSQSSVLNTLYFENEVLNLSEIMIPPLLSSTMSGQDIGLGNKDKSTSSNSQSTGGSKSNTSGNTGRPEKADDQKSQKTIQNRESMS